MTPVVATSVIALLLVSTLVAGQQAFAANPYIGGYRDSSTVKQFQQFTGKMNFSGTTSVSQPTGTVVSTTGWGSTDPTNVFYQAPVAISTTGNITGEPQIWNPTGKLWSQSIALGMHGSDPEDVSWVYYTFYWNSLRTTVSFYYEAHYNDGTVSLISPKVYTKGSADTSTNFASGYKNQTIGGSTYKFKFLQFGAESDGGSTTGWQMKMYDMIYYYSGGSTNLSSVVARSMEYSSTDLTHGTWINWDSSYIQAIGDSKYTANADYDLKSGSSLPPGEVVWYKDSTSLPKGTRLW